MTEPLRQRQTRVVDPMHLAFIRSLACVVCKARGPSDAAHVRMASLDHGKSYTAKGWKPDDRWTVPLCKPVMGFRNGCHVMQHKGSEAKFWRAAGLDPIAIAERLWVESGAAERHRFDAPGPAPRKPRKARPRPAKIKRTWPKRKMEGRSSWPKNRSLR